MADVWLRADCKVGFPFSAPTAVTIVVAYRASGRCAITRDPGRWSTVAVSAPEYTFLLYTVAYTSRVISAAKR